MVKGDNMPNKKFDPMRLLIPGIAKRELKRRKELGLNKGSVTATKTSNKTTIPGDATLINCIELQKFKPRLSSFIPNTALDTMAKNFYGDDPQRKFKIVYGTENDFHEFIYEIYDELVHNFSVLDYDKEPLNHFIQLDNPSQEESLIPITQKLIEGFFYNAKFTYLWYKDKEYSAKSNNKKFSDFPTYLSVATHNSFEETATAFFRKIEESLYNSYISLFTINDDDISLKFFNKNVLQWIQNSWPAIIKTAITHNKSDIVASIGYDAQNILNKRDYLIKLQEVTIKTDELLLNLQNPKTFPASWANSENPISIEEQKRLKEKLLTKGKFDLYDRKQFDFSKITELVGDLANTFEKNVQSLSEIQDKIQKETPKQFEPYFSNNRPIYMPDNPDENDWFIDRFKTS